MLTIKEDCAIFGVSELRTRAADLLKEIKKHRVILTKRNRPVGVVLDYDDYEKMSLLLDEMEDLVLGRIAIKRLSRKGKNAITIEEAEKKVGLR